jgi:hypothetical protein
VEQIGGFVGHQEFRTVGGAENERSGCTKPGYDDCVFLRDVALAEETADLAFETGRSDGGLDRYGQAVKRAARFLRDRLKAGSMGANVVGVEVGKDVEGRIEAGYLMEMGFGEIADGDLAGAEELKLPDRRLKHELRHG